MTLLPGGSVPYFAYGANVHPGWLRRRVPAAVVVGTAELPGYRIVFNKRGRDGAGRSNACPTGSLTDRLPGVLYRVPAQDLDKLGAARAGYHAAEVLVETAEGPLTALTWRADATQVEAGLRPWDWYVALIRAGAELHGLPEAHRRWLDTVPTVVDPDADRAAPARAVLEDRDPDGD